MNAVLAGFLDLWDALLRWYYGLRYGTAADQLDALETDDRPGMVIVQIDGLGHGRMLDAVAKGQAPFLSSLMRSGQAELYRWFTGLPSTTPVVQAGILYGAEDAIPGFRWYEKDTGTAVVCKNPTMMRRVQETLAAHGRGILEGGSSYVNMFDGGASNSLFTLAAIGRSTLLRRAKGLGIFVFMLFSPVRLARIILQSLLYYLIGLWRTVSGYFWPSKFGRQSLLSPFIHVATDVLVREIATFAAMVDIYRGLPAIFINFSSYDAWAHVLGPSDPFAYRMVHAIDANIRQIDRLRRHAKRRYDLYVLSDHGLAYSVSFDTIAGASLGHVIAGGAESPMLADEPRVAAEALSSASLLGYEAAAAEARLQGLPSEAAGSLRRSVESGGPPEPTQVPRESDIVVRNSGPLSHVYFTASRQPYLADDVDRAFPGLLERLANHPGISIVAVRGGDGPVLVTPHGRLPATPDCAGAAFEGLEDTRAHMASLCRLMAQRYSGDLVLLGRWGLWGDSDRVVTFENQRGTHGGAGGEQCYPFILAAAERHLDLGSLTRPSDLYHAFLDYSADRGSQDGNVTAASSQPELRPAGAPHGQTAGAPADGGSGRRGN